MKMSGAHRCLSVCLSGASYSSLISGIVLGYSCHPMISTSFMQIENQRKIGCHGKTSKCWWRLVVWCGNVVAASMCPPYFNTFLWHWLNSLLSATWAHYHQDIKTHLLAEAPDLAFWQGTFPPGNTTIIKIFRHQKYVSACLHCSRLSYWHVLGILGHLKAYTKVVSHFYRPVYIYVSSTLSCLPKHRYLL